MIRKTSWSTEDLQMLTQVDNHKIMYDGYEYYWLRKLEDDWERHFILNFTNKKKAFHFLIYNIKEWKKELNVRLEKTVVAESYKQLIKMLDTQEKITKTVNSVLPTIEKINHIRLIKEDISAVELSSLLKVKKSIIYRHIRTLKRRGTLCSA
tara:strand:- start:78 stop:533 length:456 start_codon:yes stop_codon:yes gene_type:complete